MVVAPADLKFSEHSLERYDKAEKIAKSDCRLFKQIPQQELKYIGQQY